VESVGCDDYRKFYWGVVKRILMDMIGGGNWWGCEKFYCEFLDERKWIKDWGDQIKSKKLLK
jgi:hypothetical protein